MGTLPTTLLRIAALLGLLACTALVYYGVSALRGETDDSTTVPLPPVVSTVPPTVESGIRYRDGGYLDDTAVVTDATAVALADGFYRLTSDDNLYGIYYDVGSGVITVTLYQEPLSFARAAAEQKLIDTLGVSEAELCALDITVLTNEYVNNQLAGLDLGLRACPGAMRLE